MPSYYEDEMRCCICEQPLTRCDRQFAMVWMDPASQPCIAHRDCLRRLGETELAL